MIFEALVHTANSLYFQRQCLLLRVKVVLTFVAILTLILISFQQVSYYQNVRCVSEMYDKDIIMLQVCIFIFVTIRKVLHYCQYL